MNKKYYKELSALLTKRARAIYYRGDVEGYYRYFYYIGTNNILSGIIVTLANNNKLSTDDLVNINYFHLISHFRSSPTSDKSRMPLFASKELDVNKRGKIVKKIEEDYKEEVARDRIEKLEGTGKTTIEYKLDKDDIDFLGRINSLLKEELLELEYSGADSKKANDNKIEKEEKKKLEFTDNGIIRDVEREINIHKYTTKQKAFYLFEFLFNQVKKKEWVYWDDISDTIFEDLEADSKIKPKRFIYDAILNINKYSREKCGEEIIERDGKEKYRVKF